MEIKLISCPLCLKPHFDGVDSLRTTLIAAATSKITCPVCNETLMGLDKLTIHLFSHVSELAASVETKTVEPEIRCDICHFTFADENILEMHQKLLHQTYPDKKTGLYSYHCHLCSKKFKMRGSLMVHLRVAHYGYLHNEPDVSVDVPRTVDESEKKQWTCDVCSKTFTTKYFLKKHKRLHTGEMPYFCSQCNKYFTFQQSYHKHMLYHSSEKPHVCSECGRAFKELSTLHNHERIHSGERPFACETCGKCFRQRVSYLVHRRIHTGAMPYKCTACEKTFRYKVSQKSHKCAANPPGSVVRTENNPERNFTQNEAVNSPIPQHTPQMGDGNFLDTKSNRVNTIVVNANGEIISQNFTFEGDKLITYPSNETEKKTEVEMTPDFFTMVMSPMTLPEVENLRLSPGRNEIQTESEIRPMLQTINEESLKELLYGKPHSPADWRTHKWKIKPEASTPAEEFDVQKLHVDELSDVRSLENIEFMNRIQQLMSTSNELFDQQHRNKDLERETVELASLRRKVAEDEMHFKTIFNETENQLEQIDEGFNLQLNDISEQLIGSLRRFDQIEELYKPDYLNVEKLKLEEEETAIQARIERLVSTRMELLNDLESTGLEIPNFARVFDFPLDTSLTKYGDLEASKKKLADMDRMYRQLKEKVDGLKEN